MKIKEVLYKTPEMTEEKLLELIKQHSDFINKEAANRLIELYNKRHNTVAQVDELPKIILEEWDIIETKKSYLTKSQRDQILAFVSTCLVIMTKDDRGNTESNGTN